MVRQTMPESASPLSKNIKEQNDVIAAATLGSKSETSIIKGRGQITQSPYPVECVYY